MKALNTKAIVEGSVLAAITAIMGIFYRAPILEFMNLFWPVPIILLGYRNNFKTSIISAVVAALIIGFLVNPITALILLLVYTLPGSIMGYMMKKGIAPSITITAAGIVLAFTAVLEIVLMLELLLGTNAIELLLNFGQSIDSYFKYINDIALKTAGIYTQLGFDQETIKQALDDFNDTISAAKIYLPAGLLMFGMFIAFINYKVVRVILNRMGHQVENLKSFTQWRLGDKLKLPMLLVTIFILALIYVDSSFVRSISTNLISILMFTYGVLGLSVVLYFVEIASKKYEIPKPVCIIFIVILVAIFRLMLPIIGMFDLTADLRRRDKNTIGGAK